MNTDKKVRAMILGLVAAGGAAGFTRAEIYYRLGLWPSWRLTWSLGILEWSGCLERRLSRSGSQTYFITTNGAAELFVSARSVGLTVPPIPHLDLPWELRDG